MSRQFLDQNGGILNLIDGDTATNADGKRFRLDGFDAFETEKMVKDDEGNYEYKSGNVFGEYQTDAIAEIIRAGKFKGIYTGEEDEYGREILKVVDANQQSLPSVLLREGIVKVDNFTTEEDINTRDQYELATALLGKSPTPYSKIGEQYRNTLGKLPLQFKETALNETDYDPDIHSGVAFRRDDRTLDNKPLGILNSAAHSFGFGLEGVQEGFYGYANALGQMTDIEMLENLGEQGVWRSQRAIEEAPDLILDYRDVESITDGFHYVLNTAATSAPYMMGGFASIAASIPLAGAVGPVAATMLAHLPNAMIYAGHTWNEMEGEKGAQEFIFANISGVLQATLERFGLRGLMQPVDMLSKAGRQRVVSAISKRLGMTKEMAEQTLNAQLKGQIARVVTYMADDFAKFSYSSFGKAMAKGATRESITEMLQESTQAAAVTFGSDTPFNEEEFKNRIINAGIGGATLGGGLSGAGNVYRQTQNQLRKVLASKGKEFRGTTIEIKRQQDESLGVKIPTIEEGIQAQEGSVKNLQDPNNPENKETAIVYDAEGNPIEVIVTSKKKDQNGNLIPDTVIDKKSKLEIKVDESQYFNKSIFDNDLVLDQLNEYNQETGRSFQIRDFNVAQLFQIRNKLKAYLDNSNSTTSITDPIRRARIQRQLNAVETALINSNNDSNFIPRPSEENIKAKPFNKRDEAVKFANAATEHEQNKRGITNIAKGIKDLKDFVTVAATGLSKLVRSVDKYMLGHKKLVTSPALLEIFSRLAGLTTGAYNAGKNFAEYAKSIVADLRMLVDENGIAKRILGRGMNAARAVTISKMLIDFAKPNIIIKNKGKKNEKKLIRPSRFMIFKAYLFGKDNGAELVESYNKLNAEIQDMKAQINSGQLTIAQARLLKNEIASRERTIESIITAIEDKGIDFMRGEHKELYRILKSKDFQKDFDKKYDSESAIEAETNLFIAAAQLKASNDLAFQYYNREYQKERGQALDYDPDYWWKNQGFDYKKVKDDPEGFKKWLVANDLADSDGAERIYVNIAREGKTTITGADSLVEGRLYTAWAFSNRFKDISSVDGFNNYSNENLFETLKRTQMEVAKYVSTVHYFGEGGWKLSQLLKQAEEEDNGLTQDDINQFAFYAKAIIDSAHGNFNRIESKDWAAINNYLSSWAIFSGLPIAMLSSLPETLMIYFNLKTDRDFKKANEFMFQSFSGMFDTAVKASIKRQENLLKQLGLSTDQSTVVDRYATGERDVSFLRAHEAFFRGVGIQRITQVQRRMNAAMGHDFIMTGMQTLALAPRKKIDQKLFQKYNSNIKKLTSQANRLAKEGKEKSKAMEDIATRLDEQYTLLAELSDSNFDFTQFTAEETLTYNQLRSLGIDVILLDRLMSHIETLQRDRVFTMVEQDKFDMVTPYDTMYDINNRTRIAPTEYLNDENDSLSLKEIGPREMIMRQIAKGELQRDNRLTFSELDLVNKASEIQMQIDDEIETGIYRFVNERIQLPGSSNRPLFFQDPHYQLMTQFNGFLSTFTANIVPKLWNTNLRKGNVAVKYDTFVLILLMLGMGGASQYLKDLLKFGQASPYLDTSGYLQRALYSSGVIGQYERVLDSVAPLYPERYEGLDSIANKILGESGPAARNIQNIVTGIGQIAAGNTESGANSIFKTAPGIAPLPSFRNAATDVAHLRNPLPDTLNDYLFK